MDTQFKHASASVSPPHLSDEEIEAEEILDAPNPLEKLKQYLDELVAGEDKNKLLGLTLCISGRLSDPTKKEMITIKSESGAGKTILANAFTKPFKTKKVGRFSEHALHYSDLENYEILYIQEIGQMDTEKQGVSTIKFLSVEDQGYTAEVTVGDTNVGFRTIQKRIPPMTVVSSTTRVWLDAQYERRNWLLHLDETSEQTERIKILKAKVRCEENEINLSLRNELSSKKAERIIKRVVESIEPCKVNILFPETFLDILEHRKLRARGDYEKLLRLLEYYCILRQRTLPKIDVNGEMVVFATPKAALEIMEVALEPLTLMTMEMDKRTKNLLDGLRNIGLGAVGDEITLSHRQALAVQRGYSQNTVRIYLNDLVYRGYLTDDGKRPKTYRFAEDLDSIERKASAISTKLENADDLIDKMCLEARKNLEKYSAEPSKGRLFGIVDSFKPASVVPSVPFFSSANIAPVLSSVVKPSLSQSVYAENKTGLNNPQKRIMLQKEPQSQELLNNDNDANNPEKHPRAPTRARGAFSNKKTKVY